MNLEYLIKVLENKIIVLNNASAVAFNNGDLERINQIEAEINEVQGTLYKLRLLQTTEQAAAIANTSVQTMMVAGVEAVQNNLSNPDVIAAFGEYDISTYATDPLHEQKIQTILAGMGVMSSAEMIDAYIQSKALGSPITGQMIVYSSQKYAVDSRMILAIIEQDSSYATAGIAVSTFNPGNVGNTGSSTRTYGSWQEGVDAVAEWLSQHRRTPGSPIIPIVEPVIDPISSPDIAQQVPVTQPVDNIPPVMTPNTTVDTSTPALVEDIPSSATSIPTSTPPIDLTEPDTTTSTPPIIESTPTGDGDTASSTQEVSSLRKSSRKRVG